MSPDGSRVAVTGSASGSFLTAQYDANGNLIWSSYRPAFFGGSDVVFTSPAHVVVASSVKTAAAEPQMALLKLNGAGGLLWSNAYAAGDFADRLALDGLGNIVVAGRDYQGYSDWITLKTNGSGGLLWSRRYDGSKINDEAPSWVTVDRAGNIYVTGIGGPSPATGLVSTLVGVIATYGADASKRWAAFNTAAGLAVRVGAANQVLFLGRSEMRLARYDQTGQLDVRPNDPTDLSASNFFTGTQYVALLSWTDTSTNEFWFEVERCPGAGCANFAKVGQTRARNATSYKDRAVTAGETYTYRVRSRGFIGPSGYAGPVSITLVERLPPAAPSNLAVSPVDGTLLLTWVDNATDETAFYVEVCEGVGRTDFRGIDAVDADVTSYTDYAVAPGATYSYRVRAWSPAGFSGYSNVATQQVPLRRNPSGARTPHPVGELT